MKLWFLPTLVALMLAASPAAGTNNLRGPSSGLYSLSMYFSFTGGNGGNDRWDLKFYKNGVHTNNPPNPAAVLQTL